MEVPDQAMDYSQILAQLKAEGRLSDIQFDTLRKFREFQDPVACYDQSSMQVNGAQGGNDATLPNASPDKLMGNVDSTQR